MSVDDSKTVQWDGKELIGWIIINGVPTQVRADQNMIHQHTPGFKDAVT